MVTILTVKYYTFPAAVKDIDRFQEKITVSLHQASLLPNLEHIKLGVMVKEELPVHYRLVIEQKDTLSQI